MDETAVASIWALSILLGIILLSTLIYHKWWMNEKNVENRAIKKAHKKAKDLKLYNLRKARIDMIEDSANEIIGFTKFIYEDANTYYFRIIDRGTSTYHSLKCYKKIGDDVFEQIGSEELIDTNFDSEKIKHEIKQILTTFTHKFEDWDGFVGDIPDHIKREGRFRQLLDENEIKTSN